MIEYKEKRENGKSYRWMAEHEGDLREIYSLGYCLLVDDTKFISAKTWELPIVCPASWVLV